MPKFLNTRGNPTLGIGVCGRCNRKFPLHQLHPDPNSPGLYVCGEDRDAFDPYRLPARQTERIVLPFVRPDVSVAIGWRDTTAAITAVSGGSYSCDTAAGAFTLTLPASPVAGATVSIADAKGTFGANPVTIGRNGQLIAGGTANPVLRSSETVAFVFHGGAYGWLIDQPYPGA